MLGRLDFGYIGSALQLPLDGTDAAASYAARLRRPNAGDALFECPLYSILSSHTGAAVGDDGSADGLEEAGVHFVKKASNE